jgi:hypothetical protein
LDPGKENLYGLEGFLWGRFMGDEIPGAITQFLSDHFFHCWKAKWG